MKIKAWPYLVPEKDLSPEFDFQVWVRQISKDCQIQIPESGLTHVEEVRDWLVPAVGYWLDRNPESLAQALYRADISKSQAEEVFALVNLDTEAEKWAEAILRRCLQKCLFRLYYAQKNSSGDSGSNPE